MHNARENPDTLIVIVHEIYGKNQHMADLCELLSKQNYDVVCPNMLDQEKSFDYSQEVKAYNNFMTNAGFENGLIKVKNILSAIQKDYSKVYIIGFSVGATIAWLCSELEYVDGVIGYYGSRIRDYLNIYPKCPVLLFFPNVEKSFDVDKLAATLDKQKIDVHICKGEHGFADPYSPKYNEELARETIRETMHFIGKN